MSERIPCEFFLIRYVPDPVKGEFTNIGVLLREAGRDETARVRFTRDWSRVRCMDADADLGLLEALEGEIERRLKLGAADPKPILGMIEDTFSNSLQMTDPRACLAETVAAELDLLMKMYVEPLKVKQERRRTGRAAIAAAMRNEFERAGVWALMRKRINAAVYTQPGDPLKIDCGYRPNGVIKMFHAVSLEADVEAAKVLAYSAPRLYEGVQRVEAAKLELTAVVEALRTVSGDGEDEAESADRYRFGVETMESQQIRVVTMNDLARAAATARIDLRV
ncbi:MAG TPA: DUF3037 domain-containing protein [Acidobacteriaceae bacterium]|nr:DUF3037 domain-containing protein [Acidobacteriaceae bacterium]